ncbi:MAG: helix-turn-helix domain-containing protein, partial [Pyrinomonadaceae bacterium]
LERARSVLQDTQNSATRRRLMNCAFRVVSLVSTFRPDWATFSLPQTLHRQEARFIQMALEDAGGVISQAARLLGLSGHQGLQYILKGRHKKLLDAMTPIIERREKTIVDDTPRRLGKEESSKTRTIRILHVEDNQVLADAVKDTLEMEGWEVEHSPDHWLQS